MIPPKSLFASLYTYFFWKFCFHEVSTLCVWIFDFVTFDAAAVRARYKLKLIILIVSK